MVHETTHHVSDEDRREFLKTIGVTSAVAAGGFTLDDVQDAVTTDADAASDLTAIGDTIKAEVASELDTELLSTQQTAFASAAGSLPVVADRGLPTGGARDEFQSVAEEGRPVYDHLGTIGFFDTTTAELPDFTPAFIETTVQQFVQNPLLADPLADLGFTDSQRVDLVSMVAAHRQRIGERHWIATDKLDRAVIENGEHIPAMTKAAMGGVLLWLEDLDQHLAQDAPLLTDDILADAVWDARAMAGGVHLMVDAAHAMAAVDHTIASDDLTAKLTSGFALQTIAQNLLPQDAYWITEPMRDARRTDLETVTRQEATEAYQNQ